MILIESSNLLLYLSSLVSISDVNQKGQVSLSLRLIGDGKERLPTKIINTIKKQFLLHLVLVCMCGGWGWGEGRVVHVFVCTSVCVCECV